MKVDRSRILEALRAQGSPERVDAAREALAPQVDTDEDRDRLLELGVDVDHLLDHLGRGGLGRMIGS